MTTEELAKLSPEEKRVKIAEACGWSIADTGNGFGSTRSPGGEHWNHFLGSTKVLPDYLNSLDAMHQAEKVLNTSQAADYTQHLVSLTYGLTTFRLIHATAAQRADAFLLTI